MGWLIFCVVLFAISAIVLVANFKNDWDNSIVEFLGIFTNLTTFAISIILIISMLDAKNDANIKIEQYNNIIKMTTEVGIPSEALTNEIINFNKTIIEYQVRSESFWTKGLYSEDVATLPLLELPEVMKEYLIDYD